MTNNSKPNLTPSFAVVGHPNKGKSSIVSALAHDRSVKIGTIPGTTTHSDIFPMSVDGEVLYNLIDTPGFQRPRQMLEELKSIETSVDKRPENLKYFIENKQNQEKYPDETRLLKPILEGAGIVYVVDGSVPYSAEYEAEMEILRWSAQPSLAIVNPIGGESYVEPWTNALRQFFSVVHIFNPLTASFEKRLDLLSSFSSIEPKWKESLNTAVSVLKENRLKHINKAANTISNTIFDILSFKIKAKLNADEETVLKKNESKFKSEITKKETKSKRKVEKLYSQDSFKAQGSILEELEGFDLFSEQSWKLFGLSKEEMTILATISGAAMGVTIDIATAGATHMLGAVIGGALGFSAIVFGGESLVETKVLMLSLGEKILEIGPAKNANLGFVLLARARLHHILIAKRSHASRDTIKMEDAFNNLVSPIEFSTKRKLDLIFKRLREEKADQEDLIKLEKIIDPLLKADLMTSDK